MVNYNLNLETRVNICDQFQLLYDTKRKIIPRTRGIACKNTKGLGDYQKFVYT